MSHITVDPAPVIEACQRYVERRQTRIEREREALITANSKPNWLGQTPSRDSVIEYLKKSQSGLYCSEWDKPELAGNSWFVKVCKLHQLAQAAAALKTTISLDGEDLDLIFEYLLPTVDTQSK